MTYYINPMWFYWMNLFDTVKIAFTILMVVAPIVYTILLFALWEDSKIDEWDEYLNHYFKKTFLIRFFYVFVVIGALFLPSKKTCQEMIIANIVTHENVEAAGESVKEVFDYVIDRLNELNAQGR